MKKPVNGDKPKCRSNDVTNAKPMQEMNFAVDVLSEMTLYQCVSCTKFIEKVFVEWVAFI